MYVNAQTLDMPADVRASAQLLLDEALDHGLIPSPSDSSSCDPA